MRCSVLQCAVAKVAKRDLRLVKSQRMPDFDIDKYVAVCCRVLQCFVVCCVAVCCGVL